MYVELCYILGTRTAISLLISSRKKKKKTRRTIPSHFQAVILCLREIPIEIK